MLSNDFVIALVALFQASTVQIERTGYLNRGKVGRNALEIPYKDHLSSSTSFLTNESFSGCTSISYVIERNTEPAMLSRTFQSQVRFKKG